LLGTDRAVQVRKARSPVRAKVLLESIFSFALEGIMKVDERGKDDLEMSLYSILGR
jgi:hypothetical protein